MKPRFPFQFLFAPEGDPSGGGGNPPATPPATPPGQLPPLVGEDLSFAEGWQSRIGDEAKNLSFKNLRDMAKSVVEGTSTITRLNQEKAELAKKLEAAAGQSAPPQLPADAASYLQALKLPDKLPEGVQLSEELLKGVSEYALQNGIPPEITSKLVEFQINQAGREAESYKTQAFQMIEQAKTEIKKVVGEQNYDLTISNAKAAAEVLGLDLDAASLIQNPKMVIALSKIHTKVSPGALKELGIGGPTATAEGKLKQAEDILVNPQNPLYEAFQDPSHVRYEEAQATYNRLIAESAS